MPNRFIDVDTKRTFSGDSPYVFFISEDGCSTGKWYTKNIVVLSNYDKLVCSIPEDSQFILLDLSTAVDVESNLKTYIDLDSISTHTVESIGTIVSTSAGDMYIHIFHIAFMSDYEGEIHDAFTLSYDSGGTMVDEVYEIAADVYMEDERLSIDLANEGVEIPDAFQRAVYPTNVRDESSDKVLLNRKWKELLIEYWNTVANKGSYKSLVNSLKFFEYGDLVRIEEYWKQKDNFGIEELIGRNIEQTLDPLIRKYLDVMSKTTYIGLYLSANKMVSSDGQVKYSAIPYDTLSSEVDKFIPEPVPELEYAALKYTLEDLSLKMTLLANYFSTYFMPIHLDLIHSTVDKLVFTNTIKILTGERLRREDWFDNTEPISCNLTLNKDYWIGNVSAYNYPDTVLRNYDMPVYWGDLKPVGIEQGVRESQGFADMGIEETEKYLNQHFEGVGAIVPVEMAFGKPVSGFIKSVRISIYRQYDGPNYSLTNTYLCENPLFGDTVEFYLAFTRCGHYCIMVQATQVDGSDFAGSWYIDVHGSIGNLIRLKRLKKIDYREDQDEFDDWFYNNLDFNDFMFTEPFSEQIKYKQWLVPTDGSESSGIGMSHLVVVDFGYLGRSREYIDMECNGETNRLWFTVDIDRLASDLYPHYWWKVMQRPTARRTNGDMEVDSSQTNYRYYLVGVRKYFDTDEPLENKLVYSRVCNIYRSQDPSDSEDPVDNYVVNVRYTSSSSPRQRGFVIVTVPVGSELRLGDQQPFTTTSETTTIPVRNEVSELRMTYTVGNHLFHDTVVLDDMYCKYGRPEYKVHPSLKKGCTTIDTSRFFPIFHKFEDIVGYTVSRKDTIVCIPEFRWVDKEVEDCRWEFTNKTTGEMTYSKSFGNDGRQNLYIQQPFIGKYDYIGTVGRGYYDVTLRYRAGETENTETVESAFRVS